MTTLRLPAQAASHESALRKIKKEFEKTHDGQQAVSARSDLVDGVVRGMWDSNLTTAAARYGVALVALGGYGRRTLFPHSDVDLLVLFEHTPDRRLQDTVTRQVMQPLWDMRLRLSVTTRTLSECSRLEADNTEFTVSLLDARYLAGDPEVFERLRAQLLQLIRREGQQIMKQLVELTRERHAKYANTVFHLEPDVKNCPGGLRDYHVACWTKLVSEISRTGAWPSTDDLVPGALQSQCAQAMDFLTTIRCFLHYRQKRDWNALSYEAQAELAAKGIGFPYPVAATEWMRRYYRHVRSIHRLALLSEELPRSTSGLYRMFEGWQARVSNADFSVGEGRIFLRQRTALEDRSILLSLFEFMARHGLQLSAEAERRAEEAISKLPSPLVGPDIWPWMSRLLVLRHAAPALRAMHQLGLLVKVFPEFHVIDALVIRDYFHRYAVDEHSFVAIEKTHALASATSDVERRFAEVLAGIERPELLYLSMLFHDIGKGMGPDNHVIGSLQAVDTMCERFQLPEEDRAIVRFLIDSHLIMSQTFQRRDIFDTETVHDFSEAVGTSSLLRVLTLLTYADVKAVNPEAMTQWKAELLWRLYAATENYLNRSVDDQRLTTAERGGGDGVRGLLDGFPRRYVLTHTREELAQHEAMRQQVQTDGVAVTVKKKAGHYELVVLTQDRPRLFSLLAGIVAAWGMTILKAEAFANKAGVVLDTFRFSDTHRTLELNPSEIERLRAEVAAAVKGETATRARTAQRPLRPAKIKIKTEVHFDNECSSHCTLLEFVGQDRPGLLHEISTAFANLGCSIEVALIDTQGHAAIDVFYLTHDKKKLTDSAQEQLRKALLEF